MTSCGVALVLLLDVSGSIDAAAWAMQRDGHAAAFRAPSVVRPIVRDGLGVRGIVGADPVEWLREHVVTDGGFVMEANGWGEFAAAVRRKLSTEVGTLP